MKPALLRVDHDDRTLQFGAHPARAVVLSDLTHRVRRWIDGLDGTRDLPQVLREGAAAGLAQPAALLDSLTRQGVIHDASVAPLPLPLAELDRLRPDLEALDLASRTLGGGDEALRRRLRAHVRVYGAGRVGAQVVALLAAAGVGTIRVVDPGQTRPRDLTPGGLTWSELGLPRQDGAVRVVRRMAGPPSRPDGEAPDRRSRARGPADPPAGRPHEPAVDARAGGPPLSDRSQRPDLVILTPVRPLDGVLVSELNELGLPHLLGSAFEGHGCVGPLVLPGQSACLHCLDLARRDRDPAWPIVTARLGGYPPGEVACDAPLASLVAAAVTGHALAYLDGRESVVTNGTVDVLPDWQWKRQAWGMHPQCRCMRNNPYPLTMVMSASSG